MIHKSINQWLINKSIDWSINQCIKPFLPKQLQRAFTLHSKLAARLKCINS